MQKLSPYTYRLLVGDSLQNTGLVELDIALLIDCNNNPMDAAVPVEFMGNLNISIVSSVNHAAVNTAGGYASVSLKFEHNYTEDGTNANNYQVRLTSGAIDCTGSMLLTSRTNIAPGVANGITLNLPAAALGSGLNLFVICISNANNQSAANSALWLTIRDDVAPTLDYVPAADSYATPRTITLTCTNNADRIANSSTTQQGKLAGRSAVPALDGSGNITTGSLRRFAHCDESGKSDLYQIPQTLHRHRE